MYLVDPYSYSQSDNSNSVEENLHYNNKEKAKKRLKSFESKTFFIYEKSEEAFKRFEDGYFDYIYIDANHNFKYALQDMTNWYNKVKEGGVLAGHNISNYPYRSDVLEAFLKFLERNAETPFVSGDDWFIVKGKGKMK